MQSIDIDGTQVPLSAASVILTSIKREIPDMFTNAETFFELLALGGDDEGTRDGIIEEFRKDMREAIKKYASFNANKSDTSDDFSLLPPPPPQQLTAVNNNNNNNNSTDVASGFGDNNAANAFAQTAFADETATTTTSARNRGNSNSKSDKKNVNPNFVDYFGTVGPADPVVRPSADHAIPSADYAITSDLKALDLNGGGGKTATKKAGPKVGGNATIYNGGGGGGLVGGGGGGGSPIVDGNGGGGLGLKFQVANPNLSNFNQNPPSDAPSSAEKWSCPSCTFGNHVDVGECEICSTKRPGAPAMSSSPRSNRIIRSGVKLECSICFNTSDEKPVYENPGKCKHQYCHECMVDYLTSKIQSRDTLSNIPCPGAPGCKSEITFGDVKDFVNKDLFQKYEQFLTEDLIYGNSGSINGFEQYIHCPTEGCNNAFSW